MEENKSQNTTTQTLHIVVQHASTEQTVKNYNSTTQMRTMKNKTINKNKHKRYNVGILIGGVHTYFPKEHISGIATAAKELDINVCFFLGTQTQDFFEDMLGGTHKDSFDYQFNTIHDYSLMGGLDGLIINYGTLGLQLKNETAEKVYKDYCRLYQQSFFILIINQW